MSPGVPHRAGPWAQFKMRNRTTVLARGFIAFFLSAAVVAYFATGAADDAGGEPAFIGLLAVTVVVILIIAVLGIRAAFIFLFTCLFAGDHRPPRAASKKPDCSQEWCNDPFNPEEEKPPHATDP